LLKHPQIFETLSLDKRSTCHGGDRVGKGTHFFCLIPIIQPWSGKSPHESEASSMQLAEQSEVGCGLMMVLVPCWEVLVEIKIMEDLEIICEWEGLHLFGYKV